MKVLVTGSSGFIGKNLCSDLLLRDDVEILTFGHDQSVDELSGLVLSADFVFHLAGVNRPKDESEFTSENTGLTEKIVSILRSENKKTPLLITSSTQAELGNPYGKSKLAAEQAVFEWHNESEAPVYVYRLPGVFGKWCRPNYNSVVATFCHNIANDLPITITDPSHAITLAYIDDVVETFTSLLDQPSADYSNIQQIARTFHVTLKELSDRIHVLHDIRANLVIPDLSDPLNKFLYATYVSYLPTTDFAYSLTKNSDDRGYLAEFIKSHQFGQIFVSSTKPGISRGDHWHQTKIEKFFVVSGEAEITFRNKIDSQDIIRYKVSGDEMKVVDIPTGYVHAITNIGTVDLITIFWANEVLDKSHPDTHYEKVEDIA